MTPPTTPTRKREDGDDPFDHLLAAYDESLRIQGAKSGSSLGSSDSDLGRRLDKAKDCLEQLERLWPRGGTRSVRDDWTPRPLTDISWTQANTSVNEFGRVASRRELGRGGCGVVFLAFDPLLRRQIALKIPRPDVLVTPELRKRFLRESQAAAGLNHPNIVTVYEAGEVGPACFLASAFCQGPTLADWLRDRTEPVPCRMAARIIAALADATHHAHDRRILHRDLKPSNVLLEPDRKSSQGQIILIGLASRPKSPTSAGEVHEQEGEDMHLRSSALPGTCRPN